MLRMCERRVLSNKETNNFQLQKERSNNLKFSKNRNLYLLNLNLLKFNLYLLNLNLLKFSKVVATPVA